MILRKALCALTTCVVVLLAACSSSSPDTTYNAPDMGTAEALPAGNGSSVTSVDDGYSLLIAALSGSSSLVTATATPAAIARALPYSNGSYHVTLAPASGSSGLSVSGSADITFVNWPNGPSSGDVIDASMTMTQKIAITADHVTMTSSGTTYTLSGKEVCNVSYTVKEKGTYPALSYSGDFKAGAGLACTIVDTSTGGKSVKVIFTLGFNGSITGSGIPATATLYVYDSGTSALIGSRVLTGTDLGHILVLAGR